MKVGLDYIPPLMFGAARMGIGALVVFAILAASGRLALPTKTDLRIVLGSVDIHFEARKAPAR